MIRKHDLPLLFTSLLQFGFVITWGLSFSSLSTAANVACGFAAALLLFLNQTVVAHEFHHRPWFAGEWANRAFAVFESVNLAHPVVLADAVHRAHHRYVNGPQDPTSTYRHGRPGEQEHWLRYAVLGLFRGRTRYALRDVRKRNEQPRLLVESAAVAAMLVTWLVVDWRFVVLGWLPSLLVGRFASNVRAYFDHFNATDPTDRLADSVNHYGRAWNVLTCNAGHHQEHHLDPDAHWSERPRVRREFAAAMQAAGTRVESWPPMFNLLSRENPERRTGRAMAAARAGLSGRTVVERKAA